MEFLSVYIYLFLFDSFSCSITFLYCYMTHSNPEWCFGVCTHTWCNFAATSLLTQWSQDSTLSISATCTALQTVEGTVFEGKITFMLLITAQAKANPNILLNNFKKLHVWYNRLFIVFVKSTLKLKHVTSQPSLHSRLMLSVSTKRLSNWIISCYYIAIIGRHYADGSNSKMF